MKEETKYYNIKQGGHDKDGKYHEFSGLKNEEDIDKFVEWGLAKEIGILEFFDGYAQWGSGNYAFLRGKWITSGSNFDSSGRYL